MDTRKKVDFGEFTRNEFKAMDPRTVVVIPIGAIEQHGPHLPVNTDSLILEQVLQTSAQGCRQPVLITPSIQYGYSPHHFGFPGVLSLQSETILALLKDIGTSVVRCGFTRIVLMTGHGGNMHVVGQTARDLGCLNPGVTAAGTSYWDIAMEGLKERMSGLTPWIPGHAGLFETSLVLAIREDLVDMSVTENISVDERKLSEILYTDLFHQAYFERHDYHLSINGVTDPVCNASKKLGESLLSIISRDVAEFFDAFSLHG